MSRTGDWQDRSPVCNGTLGSSYYNIQLMSNQCDLGVIEIVLRIACLMAALNHVDSGWFRHLPSSIKLPPR